MDEELGNLKDKNNYTFAREDAWRRIKSRTPNPRFLAILKKIAAWRELEAQTRDLPRNRILRDESLVEIAHHSPKTITELAKARGFNQKKAEGPMGKAIINAVNDGLKVPNDGLPKVIRTPPLPKGIGPITDLLKVLLKLKSEEHDVAQKLIATVDDLEKIAAYGNKAGVPSLHGWRQMVFGNDALKFRSGKLAMLIKDRKIELLNFNE